ncbi:PD-(D/E)XK nuclease family protein [Desulfonatronovibrio magnus]|uniref:PD-(D/E)XK nuclease family protein n=1 Tax=Desulfonatronovibrio magnus TaxID=698827 RepID=UPI0005EB1A79|nr:PD-(D/E)XK nuclease family protein [Desulfonatronovibrio magnus]
MNLPEINFPKAALLMESGTVLATATNRLSRHLHFMFGELQLQNNKAAWETPDIIPFSSWLFRIFSSLEETKDRPFVLSDEQELILWEQVITEANPEHGLLGLHSIAETASKALTITNRYRLPWEEVQECIDREIQLFVQWTSLFQKTCTEKNLITSASLPDYLLSLKHCPDFDFHHLILSGFIQLDPASQDFLQFLTKMGVTIHELKLDVNQINILQTRFPEFEDEATHVARHALKIIQDDPDKKVGIVVPALESRKEQIMGIFDHVFHPENLLSFSEPEARAFNVSLGSPLSSYPLVNTAMIYLKMLNSAQWDINLLSTLLRSSFIRGGAVEMHSRAALDALTRKGSQPWRHRQWVLDAAVTSGSHYSPLFADLFAKSLRFLASEPEYQSPAGWASVISRLLEFAGWPDERPLNSFEYQTFQAFKDELSQLASLEIVLQESDLSEALNHLEKFLHKKVFQPETSEAPVQILGMLEAIGLNFDHLWVMNLNADVLPAPAKPNPLLPVHLQRKYKTPGASPMIELELACQIMNSLQTSAPRVTFSYSTREDDREIIPSPLLSDLKSVQPQMHPQAEFTPLHQIYLERSELEKIIDDYGHDLKSPKIFKGIQAFKDQALCPFKGYVSLRLNASYLDEPLFALSNAARGTLVHMALMLLWQEADSLEELKELEQNNDLLSLIKTVCSESVKNFSEVEHVLLSHEFKTMEQARLEKVLLQWLQKELDRPEFTTVRLEHDENVTISSLILKTRLDRVDELTDGRQIVMDYKTGANIDSIKRLWMAERLIEPQLPIYAQATGTQPSAAVIAQVNPKQCKFHGIVAESELPKQGNTLYSPEKLDKVDMADIFHQWKNRLEETAAEIKQGLAIVDPVAQPGNKTCRYCEFMSLCRVKSQNFLQNNGEHQAFLKSQLETVPKPGTVPVPDRNNRVLTPK